jgi:hypothetical protein
MHQLKGAPHFKFGIRMKKGTPTACFFCPCHVHLIGLDTFSRRHSYAWHTICSKVCIEASITAPAPAMSLSLIPFCMAALQAKFLKCNAQFDG